MNRKTRSPQGHTFRELLGLAVIGFVLWLAAIGWLPVTAANAAHGEPRNNNPEQRLARMQTHLDLTDEQMGRIRPILETQAAKARDIRQQFRGSDRYRMRAEMQALCAETETALAEILTEDQLARWPPFRENRQGKRSPSRSSEPRP